MPTTSTASMISCLALPLVLLAVNGTARAEEKVEVIVVAILGSDKHEKIDPCLRNVAKELKKADPSLTGFRLAKTSNRSIEVSKKMNFPLVDKQFLVVTVDRGINAKNRVGLTVKPPRLGEIAYTIVCGKYFPILTPYYTKDKERLIVAIMVRPAKK